MNVFRLTKRSLVSTKSFSKLNNRQKSSVSVRFFDPFFSKKRSFFDYFSYTPSRIKFSWREDFKPWVLSVLSSVRVRVAPALWLMRETIGILTTHVKATILPILWHLRYSIGLFLNKMRTDVPPAAKNMRYKTGQFMSSVQAKSSPILGQMGNQIGQLASFTKAKLLPISQPISKKIKLLAARTNVILTPLLAPINNKIGRLTTRTKASLSPVLTPVRNKLISFTPPSVKQHFKNRKAAFFSFFAATWRLTRKESLATNFISVTIVVFCTMVYIKRQEQVLQNQVKYGFSYKDYNIIESTIKPGDAIYSMLIKAGLTYRQTDSLMRAVRPIYDFEKIQNGKPYTSLISKGSEKGPSYLVVEPDPRRYFIFDLTAPSVKEVKRDITYREFETSGVLKKNLYSSLLEGGLSYTLIDMVQEALKDKMNIKQCANGDEYKLIWEEELIDGRSVGVQKLTGLYVKGQCIPKPVYAFYYNNGKMRGWYQKDSLPVRDGFIDTPVVNSTITSHFNPNRLHPILRYRRPHLGTDFAAPKGSPIMSVADGVVEEAKYGGGNGRYVKIKHKKPYETQYLHMSRFASGIEPGTTVKQKQVIGYIGMSGLTTGPHVCFRFWKNGIAIDHLTEKFYTAKDSLEFKKLVAEKMSKLEKINVKTDEERQQQKVYLAQLRKK